MLETISKILIDKKFDQELAEGLSYVCYGGSHLSGTNDKTSDFDFRTIVIPTLDYLIGLKSFDYSKLVTGENKINGYNDFDVEIYSILKFIKEAYHGEIVVNEMLHANKEFVLLKSDILQPVFDNKELFLSKSIVFKYISMIKGHIKKMTLPKENLRRPDNIERIEKYGFETKCAMKAIQFLRLNIEFLKTKELNLYRKDRDYLMSIKQGKVQLKDILKEINELERELESLLISSSIPKKPDFDKVNSFYKDYTIKLYRKVGII